MRCEELQELLVLASGGDVTEKEWRLVSEHIEGCETCRKLYKAYCRDRERIDLLVDMRLREDLKSDLTARGRRVVKRPLPWVVTFAAAAVVAFAITIFLIPSSQQPSTSQTIQPPILTTSHTVPESVRTAFENASVKDMPERQPKYERCRILQEADAKVDF